jgi:hypothetical protein
MVSEDGLPKGIHALKEFEVMNRLVVLSLASCLTGAVAVIVWQSGRPSLSFAVEGSTQKGWVSHGDGRFRVETPAGWTAARDPRSGRVTLQGMEEGRIVIWPLFLPGRIDPAAAGVVLRRLASSVGGQAQWAMPQTAGSTALRMTGRAGPSAMVAALLWTPGPQGAAGFFYLVSAREPILREGREDWARILASFRPVGAPSQGVENPASSLRYFRWTDPRENAFSIEVPEGWRVQGGLFRFASVDVRGAWEVISPEGDIRIMGGDADLPTFTEPTQMLAVTGFPEGSWYSPGYGVRMMVRRYVPGQVFAAEYASYKASKLCAGVRLTSNRDLPQATEAINAVYSRFGGMGVAMQLTAGEASFRCTASPGPMSGYVFAGVQRTQVAGMAGGLWKAEYLAGYLAAESKAPQARAVLDHILHSIQLNPQWVAMQQGLTANASRIVSQTHAEISNIITSTYERRQEVMDELSRRRSNVILGQEDVIDPQTGLQIKVESGSEYYWIDHRGTIVGTDTDVRPNLDFRELVRLP